MCATSRIFSAQKFLANVVVRWVQRQSKNSEAPHHSLHSIRTALPPLKFTYSLSGMFSDTLNLYAFLNAGTCPGQHSEEGGYLRYIQDYRTIPTVLLAGARHSLLLSVETRWATHPASTLWAPTVVEQLECKADYSRKLVQGYE
jgi:hypothetical protein